jgi:DNA-binding transcriptional regulator LsrR (DeoR family)
LTADGWNFDSTQKKNSERIREMHFDLNMKPIDIANELGINKTHVYREIKKLKAKPILYTSKKSPSATGV